jgi:hypothetical protein
MVPGEMLFKTALIHCPASASDVLMFPAGVNGQVPDSSHGDVVFL